MRSPIPSRKQFNKLFKFHEVKCCKNCVHSRPCLGIPSPMMRCSAMHEDIDNDYVRETDYCNLWEV